MSWVIFVQDLPRDARTVDDIPDDFTPLPVGQRSDVIKAIQEIVTDADFTDRSCGKIEGDGYSIEVNLGDEELLDSFAFHVHGGARAPQVIAAILKRLGVRALDPGSESGFFEAGALSQESLEKWQSYRDKVVGDDPV
jgi:hypothetical protein